MRRLSISLGLALAAVSLLADVTPARAEERPFKALGSGYLGSFGGGRPSLEGAGQVTHLGRSLFSMHVEQDFGVTVPRTLSLRAADGDILIAKVLTNFDYTKTGSYTGAMTFTGGTGRFKNATGSASLLVVYNRSLGQFNFCIIGTIDF